MCSRAARALYTAWNADMGLAELSLPASSSVGTFAKLDSSTSDAKAFILS